MIDTYRFPKDVKRRKLDPKAITFDFPVEEEGLTGFVQGEDATDLEERVARALKRNGNRFEFKVFVPTIFSFPGQSKELDYLVWDGALRQPLGVKGFIGHNTQAQLSEDAEREKLLNITFAIQGWLPFKDVKWPDLLTQESADRKIRDIFR